jgi:polysaccharide export outer membrane protein
VAQALAVGGGLTVRGTERGISITRRDTGEVMQTIKPRASDTLQANDVIQVRESLF